LTKKAIRGKNGDGRQLEKENSGGRLKPHGGGIFKIHHHFKETQSTNKPVSTKGPPWGQELEHDVVAKASMAIPTITCGLKVLETKKRSIRRGTMTHPPNGDY